MLFERLHVMSVVLDNPAFSKFNTNRISINSELKKDAELKKTDDLNSKASSSTSDDAKRKKGIYSLLKLAIPIGFGISHGLYTKHDFDIIQNAKGHGNFAVVAPMPDCDTKLRNGVKRIIARKDESDWKPVAFFDVVRKNTTENTEFPISKDNMIRSCEGKSYLRYSNLPIESGKMYGAFKKILNPLDELFFGALRKVPLLNRLVEYANHTDLPIKESNIGNHKIFYNKNLVCKGIVFHTLLASLVLIVLEIAKFAKNKKEEKKQNEINE